MAFEISLSCYLIFEFRDGSSFSKKRGFFRPVYTAIRGRSRAATTSKLEHFVIIVNGFQLLTFITKRTILDVAAVLDPSLAIRTIWLTIIITVIAALVNSCSKNREEYIYFEYLTHTHTHIYIYIYTYIFIYIMAYSHHIYILVKLCILKKTPWMHSLSSLKSRWLQEMLISILKTLFSGSLI